MNISYEKSKSLKDIETKFKKYPRTNKNRFTRNLLNLLYLLNPRTPYKWYSLREEQHKIINNIENLELDIHYSTDRINYYT